MNNNASNDTSPLHLFQNTDSTKELVVVSQVDLGKKLKLVIKTNTKIQKLVTKPILIIMTSKGLTSTFAPLLALVLVCPTQSFNLIVIEADQIESTTSTTCIP